MVTACLYGCARPLVTTCTAVQYLICVCVCVCVCVTGRALTGLCGTVSLSDTYVRVNKKSMYGHAQRGERARVLDPDASLFRVAELERTT